jgi:hypothetical protein
MEKAQVVPDSLLQAFFDKAESRLSRLVTTSDSDELHRVINDGGVSISSMSLRNCRSILLEIQRNALQDTLSNASVSVEQAQHRLAHLKDEHGLSETLRQQSASMDQTARLAYCRLVLFMESHNLSPIQERSLQTEGPMDSKLLLEFAALCQAAVQLPCVQNHLVDPCNHPLFQDLPSSMLSTVEKLPQKRLEYVQRLCAQAIGIHPTLISSEFQRIFASSASSSTVDPQVRSKLEEIVDTMNDTIMNTNLRVNQQPLSDRGEGGFTRVVSVQHSTTHTDPNHHHNHNHDDESNCHQTTNVIAAPTAQSMHNSDDCGMIHEVNVKQQLRLASRAQMLQQQLMEELQNMSPREREEILQKAQRVQEEFLQKVASLPSGPERIQYLQSMDPERSRLLSMLKLWTSMQV